MSIIDSSYARVDLGKTIITCKYILLTKREGRTARISARSLDSTDRAALVQKRPIFPQYGPEQAWLIRDLLYDRRKLEGFSQIPCNIMRKMYRCLRVQLCGYHLGYLSRSYAVFPPLELVHRSPSFVVLLKISNSRLKQGFSKSAIHSGVLRRNFPKILSSYAILISSSKGHKCGIIRDNARSNT